MKAIVYPSKLSGKARAPASKSHFIRAVAAAMLADGTSKIYFPSACGDARAILGIAGEMGATVKSAPEHLEIHGNPKFTGHKKFDCGESGLTARLMIGIGSLYSDEVMVTGSGTLPVRQLGGIAKPLQQLGVKCTSNDMKLPVTLFGPIKGGTVVVDGSESSQFVSGLLMALPLLNADSELVVKNLKSRPYIDMTLETLGMFGIEIQNSDYKNFIINGNQSYRPTTLHVEGDWSSGAFLLVAGAISGSIGVEGLDTLSKQADKAILTALEMAGVKVTRQDSILSVKAANLNAFNFDATHSPDLFPPLAVLAANCKGITVIKGVSRLKHKESNRAIALVEELGELDIKIEIKEDDMLITGGEGEISGGNMSSRQDHRIAMAGAVAALKANGKVVIDHAECVSKSWPDFFKDIESLGAKVEYED